MAHSLPSFTENDRLTTNLSDYQCSLFPNVTRQSSIIKPTITSRSYLTVLCKSNLTLIAQTTVNDAHVAKNGKQETDIKA